MEIDIDNTYSGLVAQCVGDQDKIDALYGVAIQSVAGMLVIESLEATWTDCHTVEGMMDKLMMINEVTMSVATVFKKDILQVDNDLMAAIEQLPRDVIEQGIAPVTKEGMH